MGQLDLRIRLRNLIARKILTRSGVVARRIRHLNYLQSPLRQRTINVVRGEGVGDVLMATPALREYKKANPECFVKFYTKYGSLVDGLPYIDQVLPFADRPETDRIYLEYTSMVPSPVHLAKLFGDRLDVNVEDVRPDCVVNAALVEHFRVEWADLPRPIVVVLRRASRTTPNKDWDNASWDSLVREVCQFGTIVEIGAADEIAFSGTGSYVDLRGKTSLEQLVAAIAASDIHVGPVSGPMHIAAAVRTPSVIVIGGFEHPNNSHYPGNVEFYTPVPCAPCWLHEPCPFNLKCLAAISSTQVKTAIVEMWARMQETLVDRVMAD